MRDVLLVKSTYVGTLTVRYVLFLPDRNKRFASEEQRETSAIAYVQHDTVTAPRYYKIDERDSTAKSGFHL
jgi:hypothetical protein